MKVSSIYKAISYKITIIALFGLALTVTKADILTGFYKNDERENCADSPGFICVSYYYCLEGTIFTDAGGFTVWDDFKDYKRKCPRFLDICCPDPSVVPPPPRPKYVRKCGRRNSNGLIVDKTQDQELSKGYSLFGEWPAMCAIFRYWGVEALWHIAT